MDDVRNESEVYSTAAMNFDTTLPVVSNVVITAPTGSTTLTKSAINTLTFDFEPIL